MTDDTKRTGHEHLSDPQLSDLRKSAARRGEGDPLYRSVQREAVKRARGLLGKPQRCIAPRFRGPRW